MKRLLTGLAAGAMLALSFAADADSNRYRHRDGHDRGSHNRHFDSRFDGRHFDRNFHDRRFNHNFRDRHFDQRARFLRNNEPWRGHKGWSDYGWRQYDQFRPNWRASDHFAPRGSIAHGWHGRLNHRRHFDAPRHHGRHAHSNGRSQRR